MSGYIGGFKQAFAKPYGVVPEYSKVSGDFFVGTWILAELCLIASDPSVCSFFAR